MTNPPMRVQVAFEFIRFVQNKTQSRIVFNDTSCQDFNGQELSKGEMIAHASACHTINEYLLGKLAADRYERQQLKTQNIQRPPVYDGDLLEDGPDGTIMDCFKCKAAKGIVDPKCEICRGTGTLVFHPIEIEQ